MSFFSNLFKSRSKTMRELAFQLGMEYYDSDDNELVHSLSGFKLLQKGRSPRVTNLLSLIEEGKEQEFCLFDYRCRTGTSKNRRTKYTTVFLARSARLHLPLFYLKPKNFLHKVGEYIGWTKDIAFDSHPIFSDSYYLQGNSEIDIRQLFNTDLLNFFSREKTWYLEGFGSDFIFYKQ
ncbi:MAG TPA: hypothetical protein ENJ45_00885, partial [Phaeodactylibacter sp.]|nr:hypothetical protein [Phaeodactylibacter sp.]